jgi:hypothetical protein
MARRKGLWYALEPEDVAGSVAQATGVAGLSIEDATGGDVLLTARAECYHVGILIRCANPFDVRRPRLATARSARGISIYFTLQG